MTRPQYIAGLHGISADVISHETWGVPANALIIRLPQVQDALSSRDGFRKVKTICNCYLPMAIWPEFEKDPSRWDEYLHAVLDAAGVLLEETTALSTGVNMDYLAWQEVQFEELWVLAFVTAGVSSNAMRIGKDKASVVERDAGFHKVGTINTVVLTNACLELAPLAASFITITEAKNIALQELDVKSVFTPEWQATGTGTDQIVTVSGTGGRCKYVGGHTKLGEMIAQAVTAATVSAVKNSRGDNS